MVTVYVLIDPRTGNPFYVGMTRKRLGERLSGHLSDAKNSLRVSFKGHVARRASLIYEILDSGHKVLIEPIANVPLNDADKMERYYYDHYMANGITLLQSPYRFNYISHSKL